MTDQPTETGAQGVTETAAGDGDSSTHARVQRPSLCRAVWYADRQIPGSIRAAQVVGTRDSIAHDEGVPLPEDDMHVHLLVFPPAGSAYNAHDVAYDANGAPGTWRWPTRVAG